MTQLYYYTYYYGNGDYYSGYGYAAPGTYSQNQNIPSNSNETSSTGYYVITAVDETSSAGVVGEVYVTGYYDAESGAPATRLEDTSGTRTSGFGNSGLGSESGYVYNANNYYEYFGSGYGYNYSYYEADLIGDDLTIEPENPSSPNQAVGVNFSPSNNGWTIKDQTSNNSWLSATQDFNGDPDNGLTIQIQDDPYFRFLVDENGNGSITSGNLTNDPNEVYTLQIFDTSFGFATDTYTFNEGDGTVNIGLSPSSNIKTATLTIRDDDWNNDFGNAISINEMYNYVNGQNASFLLDFADTKYYSINVGANQEAGEPQHVGNPAAASVWWSWTAPESGTVQIDTAGSNFDTVLGVYTGSLVSSLTEVASNDNSGSLLTSQVTFDAVTGTTYYVAVDGQNGATGNIQLNLDALQSVTFNSTDGPLSIPDLSTVTSTLSVSNFSNTITDVNVTLDITHTYDSDLSLYLISPNNTRVELFTGVGSNGDNFTSTLLDDEATTSITLGSAPFTGSFQPEGLLSAFDSQNANGTWTLEIADTNGLDVGTLNSWSLTFS